MISPLVAAKMRVVTLICLIAVVGAFAVSLVARGRGGDAGFSFSLSDPRPMARAVELVQERYGWAITYEDPPYAHESEVQDVTDTVSKTGDPKMHVLVPKGGAFSFAYSPGPDEQVVNPQQLLNQLLEAYAATTNPGSFGLVKTDGMFHVVPTAAKTADGQVIPSRSVFDAVITLPTVERSVEDTIRAITAAVSTVTGTKVVLGAGPVNMLARARLETGAAGEAARSVLVRALSATGQQLTWQLCYDPGLRLYGLTIRPVPAASADAAQH